MAATFFAVTAMAQEGLFVEDLFDGRLIAPRLMKQTVIKGSQLHSYKLDTYKSLFFTVAEDMLHQVEIRVIRDAYDAEDKQMEYVDGHLTYALICLPPLGQNSNRFLCYQATEIKGLWDVTVVYLRGEATREDLNKMFNKKAK